MTSRERIEKIRQDCYAEGRKDEAEEHAWHPIETAPRDGTPIMGYWLGGKHDCAFRAVKVHNGRWWETNEDYPVTEPTHWMPLPRAPQ